MDEEIVYSYTKVYAVVFKQRGKCCEFAKYKGSKLQEMLIVWVTL